MDGKMNANRGKRFSEIALDNVRELESAVFAFWVYAREHEMTNEELVRLLGVTSNLVEPVVNSIETWAKAEGSNG